MSDSDDVLVAVVTLGGVSEWHRLLIVAGLRLVASVETAPRYGGPLHLGECVTGVLVFGVSDAVGTEIVIDADVALVSDAHNVVVAGVADGWVMEGGFLLLLRSGVDWTMNEGTAVVLLLSLVSMVVSVSSSVGVGASPPSKLTEMLVSKVIGGDHEFKDSVLVDA